MRKTSLLSARQTKMNQWNALNVNVIKRRKIECTKLNLPSTLVKSPTKKSTVSSKLASTEKENQNIYSKDDKDIFNKTHSSADAFVSPQSTDKTLNSSANTDDEVFQESFETPPVKETCFFKHTAKRCLSLPTYLTSEEEYDNSIDNDASFRPRQLFEETLNLESSSGSDCYNTSDLKVHKQELGGCSFPRIEKNIHTAGKASRTPHAERMKSTKSSSLISCDNNNNLSSDENNLSSTKKTFKSTKTTFDVRDWEQKVLVLTASDYEFGTDFSKKPKDDNGTRSRSVALTDNISTIAKDKFNTDQNSASERSAKSETNSEMPKLQNVVWDYIKRKSTKRKRKNDSSNVEKHENVNEENIKATNQETVLENVQNTNTKTNDNVRPKKLKGFEKDGPEGRYDCRETLRKIVSLK